jgi:hypothetical protein
VLASAWDATWWPLFNLRCLIHLFVGCPVCSSSAPSPHLQPLLCAALPLVQASSPLIPPPTSSSPSNALLCLFDFLRFVDLVVIWVFQGPSYNLSAQVLIYMVVVKKLYPSPNCSNFTTISHHTHGCINSLASLIITIYSFPSV